MAGLFDLNPLNQTIDDNYELKKFEYPFKITLQKLLNAKKILLSSNESDLFITSIQNRRKIINQIDTLSNYDIFQSIFFEAWGLFSSIDCQTYFNFKLPNLFYSDNLKNITDDILKPVFKMMRFYMFNMSDYVGTGESTLLCGPVGVGKTTIQISLLVLLFLLTDIIIPVYLDYSKTRINESHIPFNYIEAFLKCLGIEFDSKTQSVLQFLSDSKKMLIFFPDEIQCLYVKDETSETNRSLYISIIAQIADIGKSSHHIGVASGSSVNLKKFALHPIENGFLGYDTLNNSVYSPISLNPYRNYDDFKSILQTILSSSENIDYNKLISYYLNSGGVARQIQKLKLTLPDIPKIYYSNVFFQTIVNKMLMKIKQTLLSNIIWDPWKTSHSIPYRSCQEIYQMIYGNTEDFAFQLDNLIEKSLLIIIENNVELVYPGIIVNLFQNMQINNEQRNSRFETMAFEGTLLGWSDDISVTHPSPGHCNEEPIRRLLAKDTNIPLSTNIFQIAENLDINNYLNQWYTGVKNFEGIDGFTIKFENGLFLISINQIKTGRFDLSHELGVSRSSRNTFLFFLDQMLKGYVKLKKCFQQKDLIKLETLYFLTTKSLSPKCISYFEDYPEKSSYENNSFEFIFYDQNYILENIELSDSMILDNIKSRIRNNS